MKYGILFSLIATLLIVVTVRSGGWSYLLLWPATSFSVVALGYLHLGAWVYGKRPNGLLSLFNQLLLFPFLIYLSTVWNLVRLVQRERPYHQLTPNVFIGRRLRSHEVPDMFENVVDLTCEFNETPRLRSLTYRSFPILDASTPTPVQLMEWVNQVAGLNGTTFIHCAEGHGRTGLFAASLLLKIGLSKTPEEALSLVQSKRPSVRLSKGQFELLQSWQRNC